MSSSALVVEFGAERRTLSSALLGGGLRDGATAWLNLGVEHGYARMDPVAHLEETVAAHGLTRAATIGMMTAADVDLAEDRSHGCARAVATVGIGHALAAAGRRPRRVAAVGTINLLVIVDEPLDDAALVAAVQTATEAKTQALADARIGAINHDGFATGTATDSICVAALPGGGVPFAGPATPVGASIARAVHGAILAGARRESEGVWPLFMHEGTETRSLPAGAYEGVWPLFMQEGS